MADTLELLASSFIGGSLAIVGGVVIESFKQRVNRRDRLIDHALSAISDFVSASRRVIETFGEFHRLYRGVAPPSVNEVQISAQYNDVMADWRSALGRVELLAPDRVRTAARLISDDIHATRNWVWAKVSLEDAEWEVRRDAFGALLSGVLDEARRDMNVPR